MSRKIDEYLESIGYYDMQPNLDNDYMDDLDWREITPGDGKRRRPLYICKKGIVATIRRYEDSDGNIAEELWPVTPHVGDRCGHLNIRYTDEEGNHREEYIHRIVAKKYIDNDEDYPDVLHWDDNPNNNCVENLRWGNHRMNQEDSVRNGTAYIPTDEDRRKGNLPRMIPVKAINIDTDETLYFESINEAARELDLQQSNIWKVMHKQRTNTERWYFEKADN